MLFYSVLFDVTPRAWRITGLAQGTSYNITYYLKDSLLSKWQIDDILDGIDSSFSLYKPYSLINMFNNSASGIEADKHLKTVASKSLETFRKTDGTFDITVYPLVQAWGFGTQKIAILPNRNFIQSILPCIGSEKLYFENNQLRKSFACVKIDLNGIAQGYSLDFLASILEGKIIDNYLVELGGEIRVKGKGWPGNHLMKISMEGRPSQSSSSRVHTQKKIFN